MNPKREEVLEYFLGLLRSLSEDRDSGTDITEDTYLLGNMNWRSIEVIYLANNMQEHYGQQFPFAEFFAGIAQKEVRDISVSEWVDFIHANLNGSLAPQKQGIAT